MMGKDKPVEVSAKKPVTRKVSVFNKPTALHHDPRFVSDERQVVRGLSKKYGFLQRSLEEQLGRCQALAKRATSDEDRRAAQALAREIVGAGD